MKRRIMLSAMVISVAFLVTLAVQYSTQAQEEQGGDSGERRGGGRMNMGQTVTRMLPLEASFAYISFEMKITDEALLKVRAVYQKAWTERKELAKKVNESGASGDRGGMRAAMRDMRSASEGIREEVAEKLQDILTPEQLEKFARWEEVYREQIQRFRRGFGGGRPGGGGPPDSGGGQ